MVGLLLSAPEVFGQRRQRLTADGGEVRFIGGRTTLSWWPNRGRLAGDAGDALPVDAGSLGFAPVAPAGCFLVASLDFSAPPSRKIRCQRKFCRPGTGKALVSAGTA